MIEYFKLQYTLTKRKLYDAARINSYFTAFLCLLIFVVISVAIFRVIGEKAPYWYILCSLYFTLPLSETKRNDFLKTCFSQRDYRKARLLENLMVSLPFVIFLAVKCILLLCGSDGKIASLRCGMALLLLTALSSFLSLFNFKSTGNITIPTPFYKKPFEFIIGFRYSFLLYIIPYILVIIAVKVDNFNLGLFSLMTIFVVAMHYYMFHENNYFVWVHSFTPAGFLIEKIKTALLHSSCLCLPAFVLLALSYFKFIGILLLAMLLGYLYMTAIILTKYSTYPNVIALEKWILLAVGLLLPPLLLLIIPLFMKQSISRIKGYLQ